MRQHFLSIIITLFFFLFSLQTIAQNNKEVSETDSRVIELENFHEVMYPIWHTSYPAKDYDALRSYVGEVNKLADVIYSAKLPGILRDKKEKWDIGIKEFKTAVNGYNNSADEKDDTALLKSAENLHTKYENLVRIIRPVLKEVDQFHQLLYVIYHTYLPGKDYKAIKSVTGDLVAKAEAITKAKLPSRLETKTELFKKSAEDLLISVKKLHNTELTNDGKDIELAVDDMHLNYQKLEEIF